MDQICLIAAEDGRYLISFFNERTSQRHIMVHNASFYNAIKFGDHSAPIYRKLPNTSYFLFVDRFFIHIQRLDFGIFATRKYYTPTDYDNSTTLSSGICKSFDFHLIRMADGDSVDGLHFKKDYFNLEDNDGVHLYDDSILTLMSTLHRKIRVYEIGENGFTPKLEVSYTLSDEVVSCIEHVFRTPQAQMMDDDHMFINFGSDTYEVATNLHVIYNTRTLAVVPFFEEKIEGVYEFIEDFERFVDLKITSDHRLPDLLPSPAIGIDTAYLLSIRREKKKFSKVINHLLSEFPFGCQSNMVSPYFDPSMFHFCNVGPVNDFISKVFEFVSLRNPKNAFCIKPGTGIDYVVMRKYNIIPHPYLPLMLSFSPDGTKIHANTDHQP